MKRVRINRDRSKVDLYQQGYDKGHGDGVSDGHALACKELDEMDKRLTDLRVQNKELDTLNKALLSEIEKLKNSRKRIVDRARPDCGMATTTQGRKTTSTVRSGTDQTQWQFKRNELEGAVLVREYTSRSGYAMETYQYVDDNHNLWQVTVFADSKKEIGRKRIGGENTDES